VKVFDAKIEMISTYEKGPMDVPENWKDKIMHASFSFGEESSPVNIMVSDQMKDEKSFVSGTNVHLSLSMDNLEKLTTTFNALSEGGVVTMPLEKQSWGSTFGSCTDKFGVHWMFSGPSEA